MEVLKPKSFTQQVGEIIKPVVPEGTVEEILERVYGLQAERVTALNSYDDCNYAITVKSEYNNKYISELWPHGYLMKIINTLDSKRPIMHEAQHTVMAHLLSNGVPTQEHVHNTNGNIMSLQKIYINKEKSGDFGTHIVRLMTFLPGDVLYKFTSTPQLLYQDGLFIGKITRVLQDFEHDFFHSFDTKWSLGNVPLLKDYIFVLKPNDKKVVEDVIKAFNNEVVPSIPNLPKGYIHGDLNELNLLIMPLEGNEHLPSERKRFKFTGLIDFQDTAYSCKIYDLAINIAYLSIFTEIVDQLDVPGYILAGYSKLRQLIDEEFRLLRILIAGRLCQSLVYGAHTHFLDPTDIYPLHTAKKGWPLIHRFWTEPQEKLYSRWKMIMKRYSNHN